MVYKHAFSIHTSRKICNHVINVLVVPLLLDVHGATNGIWVFGFSEIAIYLSVAGQPLFLPIVKHTGIKI